MRWENTAEENDAGNQCQYRPPSECDDMVYKNKEFAQ
jgi:hypothetical protein